MLILITKDIFVRDEYGVKRRVWVAGQQVESYVYRSVLKTNKTVNPEDLPVIQEKPTVQIEGIETKQLVEEVEEKPIKVKKKTKK